MFEKEPLPKLETPKPELPTGEARKLGELSQEKWREHLLLFSQVKNRVLEVNPDVYTPLKLEEGKPSPLGLFAEAAFLGDSRGKREETPEEKQALEFWPEHRRSALLGRMLFSDKEGRVYRDVDLKGIGSLGYSPSFEAKIGKPGEKRRIGGGRLGLLDRDIALFDRQMSEEFLRAGIRTHRVLAIIELEELISEGKKLSLQEAIKEGIIDKNFHPVVEVRAFGSKARVEDLSRRLKGSELLFQDAKKLISQEFGLKRVLSDKEYLDWFTKTLGHNSGLIHKNGWLHNYISPHNVTLDCRIVDLDSITELTQDNQRSPDLAWAVKTIDLLGGLFGVKNKHQKLFEESYDAVFPSKERDAYFKKMAKKK